MSEPFLAEVRIIGFNFAPRGWAFCDGQILPISQNQSLFSLLGTTYGGDGRTSFALPELRGRTPIHKGSSNGTNHTLGSKSGVESHSVSVAEMPTHNHVMMATSSPANSTDAAGKVYANADSGVSPYANPSGAALTSMASGTLASTGSGQAHNNMQPFLTLNYVIALQGLFPSRN